MAPRREVLDSEDDGSDFGDGPETEPVSGDEERYKIIGASHNIDADVDSTDPSFFQRIYDQQHATTDVQDVVIPDTAPVEHADSTWTNLSSAPPPGQRLHAKDYSSLTPLTDPVPGSRKLKRAREVRDAEIIDLTDITTPSRKETSDVWDVPTSARSQKSTRTYGKRKVAQLSLEQEVVPNNTLPDTQDPYAFPDATPPTRADRHGTPSSPTQPAHDASSPVMLIPTEVPTSSDRPTRTSSSRKKKKASFDDADDDDAESTTTTTMPNTAVPSLYVTQSTLTASQKEQYQPVFLSSEEGMPPPPPEASEMSSSAFAFGAGQGLDAGEMDMYKSSATTVAYPTPSRVASTVAYPTPSRVASTGRLEEVAEELDGGDVGGMSPSYDDVGFQQSSPDVLTDMATTASSRSKRSRAKVVSPTQLDEFDLESPAPTRRTKKRKVVREAADDSWEQDPLGGTQENDDAPPHNAQTQGETGDIGHVAQPVADMDIPAFLPQTEPIDIEAMEVPATAPKPTAKSKRGRKKKSAKPQEPAPEPDEPIQIAEAEPEPALEPLEATEPPAKRKRGRPRKAAVTKPQPEPEPENEPEQRPYEEAEAEAKPNTAPQPLSEVNHNSHIDPEVAAEDIESGDVGDSKENGQAVAKDSMVKDKPTEKEKQAAKDLKTGPQKVQYRVGLSKRSRIAPLLKCLKKPE